MELLLFNPHDTSDFSESLIFLVRILEKNSCLSNQDKWTAKTPIGEVKFGSKNSSIFQCSIYPMFNLKA